MRTLVRALVLVGVILVLGAAAAAAEPTAAVVDRKSGKTLLTLTAEVRPSDPFSDHNDPAEKPAALKGVVRGETFFVVVKGTPAEGWHTYPITVGTEKQGGVFTTLEVDGGKAFRPVWPVVESQPQFAQGLDGVDLEHEKPFTWVVEVYTEPEAAPGPAQVKLLFEGQVCTTGVGGVCIPFRPLELSVPVTVLDEPPMVLSEGLKKRLAATDPPEPVIVPAVAPKVEGPGPVGARPEDGGTRAGGSGSDLAGLGWFVLQGIFWGAVSLITPCVFPMIPVTVTIFLKQAEKRKPRRTTPAVPQPTPAPGTETSIAATPRADAPAAEDEKPEPEPHSALTLATVYTLTVVIVLTIAAVSLLSVFRWLSTYWLMNAFLGGLFVYFALSLFGLYDIELPGWLSNWTSSREQQGGIVGTVFMALTFTIISFACVAPFLGGFGGTAAGSGITFWHRLVGGFAFAATFAAPFFFLALFPSLLKALPRSGAWMNSVKVVMGFLELAAAFKFFRQAEIAYRTPEIFTYELVMGVFVVLSFICGLYLLGLFRMPHEDEPVRHISVSALLMAFVFLTLAVYLMPALFKTYNARGERTYPSGQIFAWIDSFVLPDTTGDVAPPPGLVIGGGPLAWRANLKKALAEAEKAGKRVFVDFTGETCVNCKLNERNVFTRDEVRDLLKEFVLVQLYTDRIPDRFYNADDLEGNVADSKRDASAKNLPFQREKFNTEVLPIYSILEPVGPQEPAQVGTFEGAAWLPEKGFKELGRVEGLIQDVAGFKAFLEKHAR